MVDTPPRLPAALGHPVRRRILRTVLVSGEAASPDQLAQTLSQPLSNVSYHVRVLEELGALRLDAAGPGSGSLQHLYGPAPEIDSEWVVETLKRHEQSDEGAEDDGIQNA